MTGILKNKNTEILLQKQAISGGKWVFFLRLFEVFCYVIRFVVLGRILSKDDFGLMGIALLAMASLDNFTQSGIGDSIIQKKGDVRNYLNSVWTIQVIRGLGLYFILYLLSPLVALIFNEPGSVDLIRTLGLILVFRGFVNPTVICFQKNLEFSKQFSYRFSGSLFNLIVAVPAALILKNAWALILGIAAGEFVQLIASYIIDPYRPSFKIDRKKSLEMFHFGKFILITSMLKFFIMQGDDAFLGIFLGTGMLGLYQMAYRVSNFMATEISNVITQVTFPVYSKLQDNIEKLKAGYFKTTKLTTLITFPVAGGIFALAPEFISVIGEQWMPMLDTLRILCLLGAIFKSTGRPDIPTKMSFLRLFVIVITIYPLTLAFGMPGTAISVLLGSLSIEPWALIVMSKTLKSPVSAFLKILAYPFSATVSMVLLLMILKKYIPLHGAVSLVILIPIGVILYSVFILVLNQLFTNFNPLKLMKEIFKEFVKT